MKKFFIDPSSPAYYQNRLFDASDKILNRDDSLMPFIRLQEILKLQGITLNTADLLPSKSQEGVVFDYYSIGVLENYKKLINRTDVCLRSFIILEPPVVEPRLYKALPELTSHFENVYVHNICGDGYSLKGVQTNKLRKLYWPQPRENVIDRLWEIENRLSKIVVINGNHIPRPVQNELYSKRIEVMASLAHTGTIDLFGRGWDKWWSRASMWLPYWKNRSALMSIYKGSCASKYEVLSKYTFSLCFENMIMKGYVTEKIFDCFYVGTIPLYLGATDIEDLIPSGAFIDCRQFKSWHAMLEFIQNLSQEEINLMRNRGQQFIKSYRSLRYRESLQNIFGKDCKW